MKDIIITCLGIVLAVVLSSCDKNPPSEDPPSPVGQGKLSIKLAMDPSFIIVDNRTKGSLVDNVDVGNFRVNLLNSDGSLFKSWARYSDIEDVVVLAAGDYFLEAMSGDQKNAAFESPYYYGKSAVRIQPQQVQNISLECKLGNVKITISYTDKFKQLVEDATVTVDNNENGVLTWDFDELRAGFFRLPSAHRLVVSVSGRLKADKTPIVGQAIGINDVAPRQWHKVTLDIITSGSLDHKLSVNTELIERDVEIDIPDSDDIIDNNGDQGSWDDDTDDPTPPTPPNTAPVITGANFNGAPFDLSKPVVISAATAAATTLDVLFTSALGIKNLRLKIESDVSMLADMFPDVMDLANPDKDAPWYTILSDPDINIINPAVPISGKRSHTFSVGPLMSLLGSLATDVSHTFRLEVTDAAGTASAALIIKIVP